MRAGIALAIMVAGRLIRIKIAAVRVVIVYAVVGGNKTLLIRTFSKQTD
jgi:hypothetical protein